MGDLATGDLCGAPGVRTFPSVVEAGPMCIRLGVHASTHRVDVRDCFDFWLLMMGGVPASAEWSCCVERFYRDSSASWRVPNRDRGYQCVKRAAKKRAAKVAVQHLC